MILAVSSAVCEGWGWGRPVGRLLLSVGNKVMLILSNPLLLLLLWTSNVFSLTRLEGGDEVK